MAHDKPPPRPPSPAASSSSSSPSDTTSPFSKLLETGEFSDFKIQCQGEEFPVVKAIMCVQSPVIAAAMRGGFQEAQTGTFSLNDFDPETVKLMIEFMYTQKYDVPQPASGPDELEASESQVADAIAAPSETTLETARNNDKSPEQHKPTPIGVVQHVRMYAIGEYLDIRALRRHADNHISRTLTTEWSTPAFISGLREVFGLTGCSPPLFSVMAKSAHLHIQELLSDDDYNALDMPIAFSKLLIANMASRQCTLEADIRDLHTAAAEKDTEIKKQTGQYKALVGEVNTIMEFSRKKENCRNCRHNFGCYLDRDGWVMYGSQGFIIRCRKCMCKHD
ncbi:hypothetical protein AJ80_05852 [Polytolypa hystricis UAMH7299]|uniref:BTB domain-containing protein n=1 Tax=Polytolypa hystricis (strain UAMH7299) TaxID=1447883 RepID=A0A2B7Y0V8_POLH7|nr:hypothetical protein AJ80_05852 [Polytolypa hystricis UAMH7299]